MTKKESGILQYLIEDVSEVKRDVKQILCMVARHSTAIKIIGAVALASITIIGTYFLSLMLGW